ncbi:MAG TPA: hypothetical protein VGV60_01825 [Candidatus Polarisedimenticolia bacterium]|nr:hypothetical protein [Candidatus Polarisedimenticolia bacterium]
MASPGRDIYQRFELQVRTPKKRTLLDAFLPAPESLESSVAPQIPPPMPVPEMSPEEMSYYTSRRDRDDEPPAEEPKPRAKKKAVAKKKEAAKSLKDEIAEFMSRDGAGLAPDDDLSASISSALDPKPDPEKKD